MTLICPRYMSATQASGVEAALLSVLDSQRAFPEFNERSREAIDPERTVDAQPRRQSVSDLDVV